MQLFATLATVALAAVGSVSAVPSYTSKSNSESNSGECNTGTIRCCNSVEPAGTDKSRTLIDALSLDIPTDSSLGLQCSPLNTGSLGGDPSCSAMPVCCDGDNYGGLSVGCTPINVIM